MGDRDEEIMSADIGSRPWLIDASGVSLARRPRLCWTDWELLEGMGARVLPGIDTKGRVQLMAPLRPQDFLLPGWTKMSDEPFPTLTLQGPEVHQDTSRQVRNIVLKRRQPDGQATSTGFLHTSIGLCFVLRIGKET